MLEMVHLSMHNFKVIRGNVLSGVIVDNVDAWYEFKEGGDCIMARFLISAPVCHRQL